MSEFKAFRPNSRDFTSDFKDFRNFTPTLKYFRSDFKDDRNFRAYKDFRKYRDFREFRPDFRDSRRISKVVCPSV